MSLPICFVVALLSVAFADPSWKRVETVNEYIGRGETSFAKCGSEKLCLIGGRGTNRVSILDTKALVWSPAKTGPFQMHHFQAVHGPDDCVWIAGAWTGGFPNEDTVNDIWAYCRADDKWEKRVSIPRPRGAGGSVFYKGKLYLISGNVGGHNPNAQVVPWFDCYDPATNEWTELPNVPNPRDHFHVVVIGSKLYVAGGRFSTANVPELFSNVAEKVDVYDFETGKWSPLPDLPRPRGGVAAAEYDSTVILLGGESERRTAWTEVDILRNDEFVPFADMPDPRHGTGAVSCNGAVWIAGGVRFQGGGEASVDTYAYFDGDTPPPCTDSSDSNPTTRPPSSSSGTSTGSSEEPLDTPSPSPSPTSSNDDSNGDDTSSGGNDDTSSGENDDSSTDENDDSSTDENDDTTGGETDDTSSGDNDDTSSGNDEGTPSEQDDDSSSNATGEDSESSGDAPQDSPDQGESESNSEPACFPSDAIVQLEDGSIKTMDQLRIGDRVKVAHPDEYSEVYFFSHRHPKIISKSITIETSVADVSISVSPGHLVHSGGSLKPAASLKVGDEISISHDRCTQAIVTKVSVEVTKGLHNPHTFHGDIIVNRVVASTYTSTLRPSMAQVMLLPFKAAYSVLGATPGVESLNKIVLRTLDITFWHR